MTHSLRAVIVVHQLGSLMNASDEDLAKRAESEKLAMQREHEVDSLVRATGKSRVQVLNAMKVRGPSRDAVLRALGK